MVATTRDQAAGAQGAATPCCAAQHVTDKAAKGPVHDLADPSL
jgi:hypothetical protein